MKNLRYSNRRDWMKLCIAVAITVLYVIFSMQIYDLLYYDAGFSDAMYKQDLYWVVSLITLSIAWSAAIVYYWVIDRFDRWYHWIVGLCAAAVCTYFATYNYLDGTIQLQLILDGNQLLSFSITNVVIGVVLYLVSSFGTKDLSNHCSTTPF